MTATIIAFPVDRRADFIRHTLSRLNDLHGRSADDYWKQTVRDMRQHLTAAHLEPAAIEAELRAFAGAVFGAIYATDSRQIAYDRK